MSEEIKQAVDTALEPMPAKQVVQSEFDPMIQTAQFMAKATLSMPKHLHNNPGECLSIVHKALRWGMDPFSVGEKTSIINGRIMYEGQLVNAVINASGQLQRNLDYMIEGEDAEMRCTCVGLIKGETEPRKVTIGMPGPTEAKNSPLWKSNPEQQLCYKAARVWCRRFMPEVMLGVYTPEDNFEDTGPSVADVRFNQNIQMLETAPTVEQPQEEEKDDFIEQDQADLL